MLHCKLTDIYLDFNVKMSKIIFFANDLNGNFSSYY